MRPFAALALLLASACAELTEPSIDPAGAPAPLPAPPASAAAPPATVAPRPPAPPAERIVASHVLVAYKGATRAPAGVTRDKAAAKKLAEELLGRLKKNEDFAALAEKLSDDPTAKGRGGRLAPFSRPDMVPKFSDAAFALRPGELSQVVETEFGFHIIKRGD